MISFFRTQSFMTVDVREPDDNHELSIFLTFVPGSPDNSVKNAPGQNSYLWDKRLVFGLSLGDVAILLAGFKKIDKNGWSAKQEIAKLVHPNRAKKIYKTLLVSCGTQEGTYGFLFTQKDSNDVQEQISIYLSEGELEIFKIALEKAIHLNFDSALKKNIESKVA